MAKPRKIATRTLKSGSAKYLELEETKFFGQIGQRSLSTWSQHGRTSCSSCYTPVEMWDFTRLCAAQDIGLILTASALRKSFIACQRNRLWSRRTTKIPKNPLPEEYAPDVPSKKYGRYRVLASKLASGEVVVVNNEKEASKLRAAMRRLYPLVSGIGTPSHPPHKIESSENPKTKQITMKCYWLKP